jgi:hypothetical protein
MAEAAPDPNGVSHQHSDGRHDNPPGSPSSLTVKQPSSTVASPSRLVDELGRVGDANDGSQDGVS